MHGIEFIPQLPLSEDFLQGTIVDHVANCLINGFGKRFVFRMNRNRITAWCEGFSGGGQSRVFTGIALGHGEIDQHSVDSA